MKRKYIVKLMGAGILATVLLAGAPAWAGSFDEAKAAVDQEYSAGNLTDSETRESLVQMLTDASHVEGGERYGMMEAFRLTVTLYTGSVLTNGSADRILAAAAGL